MLGRVCILHLNSSETKGALPLIVRVTERWRKQCVDREDRDGKHLREQTGSCPTSALHTGAAGGAGLMQNRGRSQVG